ncbi:DUF948 domain-containing protein [Atopococcus tabaci]|uniref:DUF948 domain-containing protein n=1 Tax=Atopococcus tabaci TaxID=269774 RepID=UPI0024094A12|nr:hypothetical protein [Atopococcus tabaci]
MSIPYIIAIAIVVLALVAFIIGGLVVYKKISSTMKNISEVQSNVQGQVDHFTHEANVINERVNQINERVAALTELAKDKQAKIGEFADEASTFGDSLVYLKEQSGDISKNLIQTTTTRVKEDGPNKVKMLGRVAKRTVAKQKNRYSSQ